MTEIGFSLLLCGALLGFLGSYFGSRLFRKPHPDQTIMTSWEYVAAARAKSMRRLARPFQRVAMVFAAGGIVALLVGLVL